MKTESEGFTTLVSPLDDTDRTFIVKKPINDKVDF